MTTGDSESYDRRAYDAAGCPVPAATRRFLTLPAASSVQKLHGTFGKRLDTGRTTVAETTSGWPDNVYAELEAAGIRQVSYVPDAGHSRLIQRCQANPLMRTVSLTTEQEGVAMGLGAWLGGDRHVLLMQSSGVGNTINMLAAPIEMRVPLLLMIS